MVFTSTVFIFLFFPFILVTYFFPKFKNNLKVQNIILLFFSLAFYAYGEPLFIFVMILSIFLNWYIGLKMVGSYRKIFLVIGILIDVFILIIFKYLTFITINLSKVLNNPNLIIDSINLPIGISFFTFQMLSYIFDIYYGKAIAQKNPLYVALYISFFPQLIAGPIVRYSDIEREITNREVCTDDFFEGLKRFLYGFSKKVLLANSFGLIVDEAFENIATINAANAWVGAIAYTLQIYFDFSGYSDMAIGMGKIFGFHFIENFNYPYISKSVTEFWKRWHISLSSWFRDYVYIPLGGNRCSKQKWIINLFIVWILTGIWHGANWTFVIWGLLYFIALLVEKLTNIDKKIGGIYRIFVLLIITLQWVIFRADNVSLATRYIIKMFSFSFNFPQIAVKNIFLIIIGIVGSYPIIPKIREKLDNINASYIESIFVVAMFILSLIRIISSTYNPFIYFNF